jgi:L-asparaginase
MLSAPARSLTEDDNAMDPILILTTGGTIDKLYFDARSTYEVGPPHVEKLLAELKLAPPYRIVSLMRKDSLDLTDQDRGAICRAVIEAPEQRVLITHGTDTMVETGRVLAKVPGKTIVLTGALEPALFRTSDALFNIGGALIAVQTLPAGAYIVMNGTVFEAANVRKNTEINRFERLIGSRR